MTRLAALVAVASMTAAVAALAAPASPPPDLPADGFDHIAHHGRVEAKAIKPPACDRCHAIDKTGRLVGTPGHAACFGSCHGKPPPRRAVRPYRIDADQRPVCVACHRPAQLDRLLRGGGPAVRSSFPPYGPDGDFAIAMSHAAHASVTGGCRACHATPVEPDQARRPPPKGHGRCASCHARGAGGAVAMTACASCHTPAVGPDRAPRSHPGPFPVGRRFSHRKHLARGGACATCHAGAAAEKGELIPTPKKAPCATCHDGKKAFNMVEPACRKCHAAPDREEAAPDRRRRARFSHRTHAQSDCRVCHELDARGMPGPIGRGHQPCSDARCHASDFTARQPTTCTVCHARAEPWRDLHIDPQPADASEFAVDFPHKVHAAPCARCHVGRASGRFGRVAGHDTCSGSGCHARSAGSRPSLTECASCHRTSAAANRRARRWSVRDRFSHRKHLAEPSDPARAVACSECHTTVAASNGLADLRPPAKPTCARCHDGGAAFKLTGHSCHRCHRAEVSGGGGR